MSKTNKELERLKELISGDRNAARCGFEDVLSKDISRVLSDYFEIISAPEILIGKGKGEVFVKIEFAASRIRPFSYIAEKEE